MLNFHREFSLVKVAQQISSPSRLVPDIKPIALKVIEKDFSECTKNYFPFSGIFFALIFPETTEKLVLVNPIGLEDYQAQAAYQPIDEGYQNELKNTAESYKKYQLTFYYDNRWKPEYDRWLNLLAGWTLHPDYPLVAWNAALTSDVIFTQPVVHEFKNVKAPTLLIIGTRDRTAIGKDRAPKEIQPTMGLYNELGRKTQQQIPNAQLVELDDVGHLPHIEAFDRFITPLLKFLGE